MTLRIAFAGTSDFAVPSLRACLQHCDLALVITQPDKPGNRGEPAERPVADAANELGIEVYQPPHLKDNEAIAKTLGHNIDALVVASYGQIVPTPLLECPKFGGINVHPSLLPRWRGASPVVAPILAGDPRTGVCIMKMDDGLDTGPVYACKARDIGPRDTSAYLLDVLAADGAELLAQVLADVENGSAKLTPQDEQNARFAPRLERGQGAVDWSSVDAIQVDRMVRALNPWPGVTATIKGRELRILNGEPSETSAGSPGDVISLDAEGAVVATGNGGYRMLEVQPPGRRPMSAAAFFRGVR